MPQILSFDVGMRNLSLCWLEYKYADGDQPTPWSNVRVLKWEVLDILDDVKNAKTVNIHDVSKKLMDVLQERIDIVAQNDLDYIAIEQQPMGGGLFGSSNKSGSVRMKLMQHVIINFYELFYRWHPRPKVPEIVSISPGNKLKCVLEQNNVTTTPLKKTLDLPYRQRKQKAVEYCVQLMQWIQPLSDEVKALWCERKKQDDLADCFMQAVYVIQTSKPKPPKTKTPKKSKEQPTIQHESDSEEEEEEEEKPTKKRKIKTT